MVIALCWSKDTSTHISPPRPSVWHAVERLGKAIHDEPAKRREGEDWSLAKDYVRSVLHSMT
jgi:hypothetical protein